MTDLTDASIQVRISRKTLATLAAWFYSKGDSPRSLSELARNSMEILKEFIVQNNFVPQVESTLEATKAFEKLGIYNLSVTRDKRRTENKYLKQMQIDEGAFDPFPSLESEEEVVKVLQDKDEEVKKALESVPEGSIVEENKEEKNDINQRENLYPSPSWCSKINLHGIFPLF